LTHAQSRARTRQNLLNAALTLFARDGYIATTVDNISEEAGYSKGAAYSNFDSKEEIFLEVLDRQGREGLEDLLVALDHASGKDETIDLFVDWANDRATRGSWSMIVIEQSRAADASSQSLARQTAILHSHWEPLGRKLVEKFPDTQFDAVTIGVLLYEISHAPAVTFIEKPKAGDLMRLALSGLLR
jgi:AcrR family transcriptional regulator